MRMKLWLLWCIFPLFILIQHANGIIELIGTFSLSFPGTNVYVKFLQVQQGKSIEINIASKWDKTNSIAKNDFFIIVKTIQKNTIKDCSVGINMIQCYFRMDHLSVIDVSFRNSINSEMQYINCNHASYSFFSCLVEIIIHDTAVAVDIFVGYNRNERISISSIVSDMALNINFL